MHIIQFVSCQFIIKFHPKAAVKAAPDENRLSGGKSKTVRL